MNLPFKFTMVTTNHVFALWNPYAVETGINGNNEALAAVPDPSLVGLLPPSFPCVITGLAAMTDTAGDAKFSIGYYDTVATAFYPLYTILATDVSGGGIVQDDMGEGIVLPIAETRVPAIRYDGTAGGVVTGMLRLHFVPDVSAANDQPGGGFIPLLDEDGAILFDENLQQIFQS